MLVLTRRIGQWITIGDEVRVRVISVKGDQVQLGIEAPKEIAVHRGEIFDAIRAEMDVARRSATDPDALARLGKPPRS